jgi:acyl-CoA thioesterase-2
MGDLAVDTAVVDVGEGDGGAEGEARGAGARRFSARLSGEWEIWGPMGGYVASVALRAAGAASPFARPASFSCHYLGVAAFDRVDIAVTTLRAARTALSQRVEVTQGGKPIMEATVWSVGDVDGLAHDVTEPPDVPGPDELKSIRELVGEEELEQRPFPFWRNFDSKPIGWTPEPPTEPLPPVWRGWLRFLPASTFEDPWVDACRSLVLVDLQSWPSAVRQHFGVPQRFIAPSLDLYVSFNDPRPGSEWLLADGYGPVARDGLMAWNGRLWSDDGHLVASGGGQMLCRRLPDPPPAGS